MKQIATPKDATHGRMIASVLHDHARRCKEPLTDCKQCQRNMTWFAGLSLPLLSAVLEDIPALHCSIKLPALPA